MKSNLRRGNGVWSNNRVPFTSPNDTIKRSMHNNIKLVIFDIGGVLIEYGDVFKTVSKEQNVPVELIDSSFDKYDREVTTGKMTPQELYISCIKENNLGSDRTYDFGSSWINDYAVIKPTYNFMADLAKDYPIALFSNIYAGFVPELIKREMLPNIIYKYKFISCDLGMQKPEKNIYERIEAQSRLKASELFLIDDKEENLAPAIKLGWKTYKFPRYNAEVGVAELRRLLAK